MGITRDSRHKRRPTGGRFPIHKKKRKYELGRNPAMTKLGATRIRPIRCRGGNMKFRALRLDAGSFSWGSEGITRKTRITNVVYNASNNELVRTNTLVKNTIVLIDATPFRQWFFTHYNIDLGKKKVNQSETETATAEKPEVTKTSISETKTTTSAANVNLDQLLIEQFNSGRLLACISSRPGQCGRADGYVLEGAELSFYKKKLEKKKSK